MITMQWVLFFLAQQLPTLTMIATSTTIAHLRQRSPTSDWCVSRSVGGTDNRAGRCSEAKTQTYVFRTRWVIQKTEKETPWLTGLETAFAFVFGKIFLWISFYLHHDHGVISVINVINILYVVQKKMHYLKLVQRGQDVNLLRRKYRCSHLNGSSIIVLVTDFWKKKISRKYILSHLNRSSIIVQLTDWV